MSRNFELLQRAGWDQDYFVTPAAPEAPPPPNRAPEKAAVRAVVKSDGAQNIVRRVFLARQQNAPRMVVFAGVSGDAGCSSICASTALALAAQATERVCVVDANTSNPRLHREFGSENVAGLADAMLRGRPLPAFTKQIDQHNLWLLTAGNRRENGFALSTSADLEACGQELRAAFGFVLIDAPAVATSNDALALSQMSDGAILVLGSSATPRHAALQAKQRIEATNTPVLGVVLRDDGDSYPNLLQQLLGS
jgi:Mrp family chromosome partitioning ATPase